MLTFPKFSSELNKRKARGYSPCAAVIPRSSPLAEKRPASVLGLSVSTDPHFHPNQIIFFDDPQLFATYVAKIP